MKPFSHQVPSCGYIRKRKLRPSHPSGRLGSTLQGSENESSHLFHVGLGHVDVGIHLLKVLLCTVGLLAVTLKPPLTLKTEHSQARWSVTHPVTSGETPTGILPRTHPLDIAISRSDPSICPHYTDPLSILCTGFTCSVNS